MPTISLRLDDEVITRIEAKRGDEPKADFYRKLIDYGLTTLDDKVITEDTASISDDYKVMTERLQLDYALLQREYNVITDRIAEKDKTIRVLENTVGFLQMEFSKLDPVLTALMPAPEEVSAKKWWHFWK